MDVVSINNCNFKVQENLTLSIKIGSSVEKENFIDLMERGLIWPIFGVIDIYLVYFSSRTITKRNILKVCLKLLS